MNAITVTATPRHQHQLRHAYPPDAGMPNGNRIPLPASAAAYPPSGSLVGQPERTPPVKQATEGYLGVVEDESRDFFHVPGYNRQLPGLWTEKVSTLVPQNGDVPGASRCITLTYQPAENDRNGNGANPGFPDRSPWGDVPTKALEDYVMRASLPRNQEGIVATRVLLTPKHGNPAIVFIPRPIKRPPAVLRYPYSEEVVRKELDRKMALIETLDYPGWDTHYADPLNRDSMADARRFLEKRPSDVPLPFAQINSDGQVGFYWDTKDMHASVVFEGNGLLSYYTWQANSGGIPIEHLGDDVPFSEGWPAVVTDVLRNL